MNYQLSNISTQYSKFSKGQYIRHPQFNEFLDFFEDQDRLSRVMLQGVGIVCGLEPQLIYSGKRLSSLKLSYGVALTTDGDILTLNNTSKISKDLHVNTLRSTDIESNNYRYFKAYDNFKVKYPAFYDESGEQQIELWELSTTKEANSDLQPINNFSGLEDKYLLLYLEDYEKELRPCKGVDCDNHGIQQIRNLKVLLTSEQGINYILEKDKIHPHPSNEELTLDEKIKRIVLEPKQYNVEQIKKLYQSIIEDNNYGEAVFNDVSAISQIMKIPITSHQSFQKSLERTLAQDTGFQYAYDVVKDLMDTYSEIIKLLPKAFTKYLPDLLSFPKHIMLGKLMSNTKSDPFRHQFYNSPVLDDEKATQRVKMLIERFNQQVKNFKYSFDSEAESRVEIKITPSQNLNSLSSKAIPFYYKVSEDFLKKWNFDKTSNRSSDTNLGYDTNLLSLDEHIQDPINFNIDKNSFYRIEGHQGMPCQDVFDYLTQIKDKQQLGFDIMMLSLEEQTGNKDVSKAYFTDYIEMHPGLEHKSGVERGGTFVIVYQSLINPKVIADFSLPYSCCTSKTEIKLSLPSGIICKNSPPVPFTVLPIHGVVACSVANDAVFKNRNGQYFFDPSNVGDSVLNQEIKFTVNGKPTNCTIKVVAQPDVKIVVNSVTYPEGGSKATKINFTVSGDNFADFDYKWDFLDNGNFITLNPDANGNVSYTFYNLIQKRIPIIRINVNRGGCTQNITLSNWYSTSSIVINSISFPKGNCCE